MCWHLPIFPDRHQSSIFGTIELNFRVRHGNGWTLNVINTNSYRSLYDLISISLYCAKVKIIFQKLFYNLYSWPQIYTFSNNLRKTLFTAGSCRLIEQMIFRTLSLMPIKRYCHQNPKVRQGWHPLAP